MALEPSNLEESYLTVAEVAELLKLNQQTVRNWIDQGSLPALRVGRRVRIRRSDLERLLREGSTAAARSSAEDAGPNAEDFWGGELVGLADSRTDGADRDSTDNGHASTDNGHASADNGQASSPNGHDLQPDD
jgi:excisionase family DNA binding protein